MDFDKAKENIQPLAGGRNPSLLEMVLAADSIHDVLQEQRKTREEAIQNYSGDDPLEVWFDYIVWIEQSYPSGGRESRLEEILQKCVMTFEHNERYKQDRRMIKLYIKYIDAQPNPQDYYAELWNHGIGTMVADLYICWAYYYDVMGNFAKADEIFRKGLDARAEPYDELEQAHFNFGFTMSQRILHQDKPSQDTFLSSLLKKRHVLTSLKQHKKKVGSVRSGAAVKSLHPGTVKINENTPGPSNTKVAIFEDQNVSPNVIPQNLNRCGDEAESPKEALSIVKSIMDSTRKQENLREPGPWANAKMSNKLLFLSHTNRKLGFSIAQDDFDNVSKMVVPELIPCSKSEERYSLGIKLPKNHAAQNIPSKYWHVDVVLGKEQYRPDCLPCYPKTMIYPKKDREYSPEELRAYYWWKRVGGNEFTKRMDTLWADNFAVGARLYPNFSSRNFPQEDFIVPRLGETENLEAIISCFAFKFDLLYPNESEEEFSIEEILLKKIQSGKRKIQCYGNETVCLVEEMDETLCEGKVSLEGNNKRKSVFMFARKTLDNVNSMPITSSTAADNSAANVLTSAKNAGIRILEETNGAGFKVPAVPVIKPLNNLNSLSLSRNDIVNSEDVRLEADVNALKSATTVKPIMDFAIFEDNFEENEGDNAPTFGYGASETCSTQTFNFFLKSQSVSTPKNLRKSQWSETPEFRQLELVSSKTLFHVVNSPGTPIDSSPENNAASTVMKQLSTIMETTEPSKSVSAKTSMESHSSPEEEQLEVKKSQKLSKRLSIIGEDSLTDCNQPRSPKEDHEMLKDAGVIPSMMASMKIVEEKTETVPNAYLLNQLKQMDAVAEDDFYDYFTKTPVKEKPQTFEPDDSLSFSNLKDLCFVPKPTEKKETEKSSENSDSICSKGRQESLPLTERKLGPAASPETPAPLNFSRFQEKSLHIFDNETSAYIKREPITTPESEMHQEQSTSIRPEAGPSTGAIPKIRSCRASSKHEDSSQSTDKLKINKRKPSGWLDLSMGIGYDKKEALNHTKSILKYDQEIEEVTDENENVDTGSRSIYVESSPKTPLMLRHAWDSSDDYEFCAGDQSSFVHPEFDLDHSKIILDNQLMKSNVNPFGKELIEAFLVQMDMSSYIHKLANCTMVHRLPMLKKGSKLETKYQRKFDLLKVIGEGSYGTILFAKCEETGKAYAVKQEKPANLWEYYICLEVQARMTNVDMIRGFMQIDYAVIGNNASAFISEYSPYGSLITVCNKFRKSTNKTIDEHIVMIIARQLLSIIDNLHSLKIIHADIKPDNFLLVSKLEFDSPVPDVQLIDFGISIDMELFPPGQEFLYVSGTAEFQCVEMRERRPWNYQLDLFGLAGTIHVLLFGTYMDIEKKNCRWYIKRAMPRYINRTLWSNIFAALLNIENCSSMPNLQKLRSDLCAEITANEKYTRQKIAEFNIAIN